MNTMAHEFDTSRLSPKVTGLFAVTAVIQGISMAGIGYYTHFPGIVVLSSIPFTFGVIFTVLALWEHFHIDNEVGL